MINQLHQPLIFLNLQGGVVQANLAADLLMKQTQLIKIEKDRFFFPDPYMKQFQQICLAMDMHYRTEKFQENRKKFDTCIKLKDENQETLYAFCSLILLEEPLEIVPKHPLVMLTLYYPCYAPDIDMHLLTSVFALTPAECRVASLLIAGYSIKEIAQKNQVKPDTVKKRMQAIYEKTATHRQSDLVRLLLNLPRQTTVSDIRTSASSLGRPF